MNDGSWFFLGMFVSVLLMRAGLAILRRAGRPMTTTDPAERLRGWLATSLAPEHGIDLLDAALAAAYQRGRDDAIAWAKALEIRIDSWRAENAALRAALTSLAEAAEQYVLTSAPEREDLLYKATIAARAALAQP